MRPHPLLLLPLLGLAALVVPARAACQSQPLGPITFEEQSPLQRLSYTPRTEIADPVAPGQIQASLWLGYSNIFEQDSSSAHLLYLDMESLLTSVTLRYGLSGGWEVGGTVTSATTGGGFMDSFLINFHRALGVTDGDRASFPRNRYRAVLVDASGRVRLDVPQYGLALDNVRLFAKWQAYRSSDGRHVLSLRAVGEAPGDRNITGGKRANLALMALGRWSWTHYHVYGTAGASTVRVGPELRPLVRSWSWFFMLGAERSLGSRVSVVGEVTVEAPRLRGFRSPQLDGVPINLVLGFAGRAGKKWAWNAGLQEDTPPNRPSVDFTACLGLSRTW